MQHGLTVCYVVNCIVYSSNENNTSLQFNVIVYVQFLWSLGTFFKRPTQTCKNCRIAKISTAAFVQYNNNNIKKL